MVLSGSIKGGIRSKDGAYVTWVFPSRGLFGVCTIRLEIAVATYILLSVVHVSKVETSERLTGSSDQHIERDGGG